MADELELTAEDTYFESAADNPELVEAAAKVAAGASSEAEPPPVFVDPTDGPITLLAGFRRSTVTPEGTVFETVRKAWVRELNGEDEEKIARARLSGEPMDFMQAVLECGLVKLGDLPPTKDDLNALVLGDRDYILMEIARATYGDRIEYAGIQCPHCGETFDVGLSVKEDIPVKRLDNPDEWTFEVRLKKDRVASVSLPTNAVSRALAEAETGAEANTVLIANSVQTIKGPKGEIVVGGDKDVARKLSVADRQALVDAMYSRMPGPQYNGVKFNHEPGGCGEEVRLGVTLADLFRSL